MRNEGNVWAELVRSSVSAMEAGRALGLEPNRDGRCACPMHNGRGKNLKLWTGDKGYYCFVCHAHGDVIELVQNVNGCGFTEAVQWLSDAFHLGVDTHTAVSEETRQRAKKRAETRRKLNRLHREAEELAFDVYLDACDLARTVDRVIEDNAPKTPDAEWDEAFCKALKVRLEAKVLLEEAEQIMMGTRN